MFYRKIKGWSGWVCLLLGMHLGMGAQLAHAQTDAQLGREYLRQGEYEKAKVHFAKVARTREGAASVHQEYLQVLLQTNDPEAEAFLKWQLRNQPANAIYQVDYLLFLEGANRGSEAEKVFGRLEKEITDAAMREGAAAYLLDKNQPARAGRLYRRGREQAQLPEKYAYELAQVYRQEGNLEAMLGEYLNLAVLSPETLELVKTSLQDDLTQPEEYDKLEKVLLTRIQQAPNQPAYPDILLWHYIQQKEFGKAFVQAKAADRRNKLQGNGLLQLGYISLQNADYASAVRIFEYLTAEYPNAALYAPARENLIKAREELVKNSYPVDPAALTQLVEEYQKLFSELGKNSRTRNALRNLGLLYAFQLNKKDSALLLLNEAVAIGRNDASFVDRCKLDLGDIYLLKGEPWEATLLYSQVEKNQKEQPLGHDAKLRNAKLSFYRGDFELAQAHLDVLKLATSREIANDAMDLSLLIQDNLVGDSVEAALKAYAGVELLLFQNRTVEALAGLESLLQKYPDDRLMDEVLWLRANVLLKLNQNEAALTDLEKIITGYGQDILGDDAWFLKAKVREEKLKDRAGAMALYEELLTRYPGSLYAVESRKRFRRLRGDTPN